MKPDLKLPPSSLPARSGVRRKVSKSAHPELVEGHDSKWQVAGQVGPEPAEGLTMSGADFATAL